MRCMYDPYHPLSTRARQPAACDSRRACTRRTEPRPPWRNEGRLLRRVSGQMLRLLFWTLLTTRASTAPSGTIPSTTQEAAPLTGSSLATMVAPGAVQSSFTDGSDRPDISFDSEYDALSVLATSLGDSDIIGIRRQLFTDSPVANGFILAGIGLAGCILCTGCFCWAQAGRARMLSVEGGATTQGGGGSVLGGFWHWGA